MTRPGCSEDLGPLNIEYAKDGLWNSFLRHPFYNTGVLKINVFKIQVRETKENMYELATAPVPWIFACCVTGTNWPGLHQ